MAQQTVYYLSKMRYLWRALVVINIRLHAWHVLRVACVARVVCVACHAYLQQLPARFMGVLHLQRQVTCNPHTHPVRLLEKVQEGEGVKFSQIVPTQEHSYLSWASCAGLQCLELRAI